MLMGKLPSAAALLLASASVVSANIILPNSRHGHAKRQANFPLPAADMKTFTTPTGVTIRYKEPGKEGVCETTPGVNSYSGYIDLAPDMHTFFWFFESRRDPANDDLTLWLNGGPGSDSLIGLLEELGPCRITDELEDTLNPWSWNEVSNMLFISQPVGTGFSYSTEEEGSLTNYTGQFVPPGHPGYEHPTGVYALSDANINTTDLAAVATWHALQAFLEGLPSLEGNRAEAKNFNLWTESYGGHYGPSFFSYFQEQNAKIADGSVPGYPLNFKTLGLINALIDEYIQAPGYPEMAVNNSYGIKAYNDTVYNYVNFAMNMPDGCLSQIAQCASAAADLQGGGFPKISIDASKDPIVAYICSEAANMCRDNVEGLYFSIGDRGTYDIRHPKKDPTPPDFADWLQTDRVKNALGATANYTKSNDDIFYRFADTGDFIYPNFVADLADIIDSGVRVGLFYGDADYICNWIGGEIVSQEVDYKDQDAFGASGYVPFMWNGTHFGDTREYGNYSFTRVFEAGHEIPFYQPQASLAFFTRMLDGVDIATGDIEITANYTTVGDDETTYSEPFEALPKTEEWGAYSTAIIASYYSIGNLPNPDAATHAPDVATQTTASVPAVATSM
ncbi:carboxypeptidase s1 like protein [Zymoseptoria brevis]|uniref:Carboxypeptidase n=1 Tax=Zymoseptoria brevis TaxID=1047168 RepID=A0A0F4G8E0_9PEZI|nr:carboxypeptidase s1 like protein [Zymoseptoria brevis]